MSLVGDITWDMLSAILASNFVTKETTVTCGEGNAGSTDDCQAELAMGTP